MYAIAKILEIKFCKMNITKHQLAERMGYKNIMNGVKNITLFFRGEYYDEHFLKRLKEAIPLEKDEEEIFGFITGEQIKSDEALLRLKRENNSLKEEIYKRKRFVPFVYRKTSFSRPTSITFAALCGGSMKFRAFRKDFTKRSFDDQLKYASRFIRLDYTLSKGTCLFFGSITGYYFQQSFDNIIEYNVLGEIINESCGDIKLYPNPFNIPYVYLK